MAKDASAVSAAPKTRAPKTNAAASKEKKPRKAAADGEKRSSSPYNLFMKEELPRVKKANPSLNHKDAFKVAAQNVRFYFNFSGPLVRPTPRTLSEDKREALVNGLIILAKQNIFSLNKLKFLY